MQFTVSLSRLHPGRHNPRRVKPDQEAHRRLVALIRAHGLLHPLVVRPHDSKSKDFVIVAGNRRLAALREIHRGNGDPRVPCVLKRVDPETADAMSLGENFGREPMHPLDEAEAFAKLASHEGKGAESIAADFGTSERYVRQRMKLAILAPLIKQAYREGTIDTGIAEAFASVPEDRQLEVWKEVNGHPRHAEHVRNVIANEWIDADLAHFDRSTLPESAVSQDLFGDRVLVERKAFLDAQGDALLAERGAMTDDGWSEVIVGRREDMQDRLLSMDPLPKEFDAATSKKLQKIRRDREKLEKAAEKLDEDDEVRLNRLQRRYEALEAKEREIEASGTQAYAEETKARASVFLILDPDGRVHREYRMPRRKRGTSQETSASGHGGSGVHAKAEVPSSADLSDRQRAVTFTHQAICVREALLKDRLARKRLLVLILHEKVRSDALAIRQDVNSTTLCSGTEGFVSAAQERIKESRAKLDPFTRQHFVEDSKAYEMLGKLSEKKLDALIDLLTIELLQAHLQRPTELVARLAEELKVNVRDDWKPDAAWLSGFQKIQLAHLVTEVKGPGHVPSPERKKSELVTQLAKLFADAADGRLEDKELAAKVNAWLPANLRAAEKP